MSFYIKFVLTGLFAGSVFLQAQPNLWTTVASGLLISAFSIVLNYWLTSRTAKEAVAKELGKYSQKVDSLQEDNTRLQVNMEKVLQQLGVVQGKLENLQSRRR